MMDYENYRVRVGETWYTPDPWTLHLLNLSVPSLNMIKKGDEMVRVFSGDAPPYTSRWVRLYLIEEVEEL